MRADSSLRQPRNSLINDDAAMMKVSACGVCHWGKATMIAAG